MECLDILYSIMIENGSNTLNITNDFPFKISEFSLNINSDIDGESVEFVSISSSESIDNNFNSTSALDDKNLGCKIDANILIQINRELELKELENMLIEFCEVE